MKALVLCGGKGTRLRPLVCTPPGTGDVSPTIAQTLPQSYMLLVTTPQEAAAQVARLWVLPAGELRTG